jgi:hypothetical protein
MRAIGLKDRRERIGSFSPRAGCSPSFPFGSEMLRNPKTRTPGIVPQAPAVIHVLVSCELANVPPRIAAWKLARDNKIQYSVVNIYLVVNIEYFIIAAHLNTYRQTVSKYVV